MPANYDEIELDFEKLPQTEDGVPIIEFGGETYSLPYYDLLEQTVEISSLAQSINEEGVEYPIIVDQENRVIDGMTRLYLAKALELDPEEVDFKVEEISGGGTTDAGWWKAMELNANRRQLTPRIRRGLLEKALNKSKWSNIDKHQKDFARLFGVSEATISRDLDTIQQEEDVKQLKREKRSVNQQLTGLRGLVGKLKEDDFRMKIDEEERETFQGILKQLELLLEEERGEIDEELSRSKSE